MFKNIILWTLGVLSTLFILFIFYLIFIVRIGPVDTSKVNSIEVTGIADDFYEGGVKDLVVKLKNDDAIYYINRALENGFNLEKIKRELLGKEITLWHAKSRSRNGGGHMMQLKYQDSIYYTEWKNPLARKN